MLTHGHEDHVGALPYVLREVEAAEVVATRLTLGLIKSKLDEHGLGATTELREAEPEGEPLQLGPFTLRFVRMAHSIPDAVAIVVETPRGASCTPGTGSSTIRRSTGSRRTWACSPSSGTPASI